MYLARGGMSSGRLFGPLFFLGATLALVWVLHVSLWPPMPPLGKFLDPINGFWANGEKEPLAVPELIAVPGMESEATVYWDKLHVPHIFAKNTHDLYLMQGYVTAYHRLWQMEFQTYKASGRLAEVLGSALLPIDRKQRRLGIPAAARATCETIMRDETTRMFMEAYAAGVNAYLADISYKEIPIEYKLLDYLPEPWTPYRSCLMRKEMSSVLSLEERDMENTNLVQFLGKETFDFLFPNNLSTEAYVVEKETPLGFTPLPVPTRASSIPKLPPLRRDLTSKDGSNNLVIAKEKSHSGRVLMGSEPDLDLTLPSLWYFAHLHAPGHNVAGATLPGLPGVIIGANDSIAWSFTNAARDLADWYAIRFVDATKTRYWYDSLTYYTKRVVETIKVRGAETFYDSVLHTHHGPVVYDHSFRVSASGKPPHLALRWSGHGDSNDIGIIHKLAKSKNYEEYLDAIKGYEDPPQNIAFAAADGTVAMNVQGKYPLKGYEQGKFVLDGSLSQDDYRRYIPSAHNPAEKNPEKGFVSSSNQEPIDASKYPYFVYHWWYERYRNRRINDLLQAHHKVAPQDVMDMQNDNFNYIAYEFLPIFLENLAVEALRADEVVPQRALNKWDYFNHGDRVSPVYFSLWHAHFKRLLWDELRDTPGDYVLPEDYRTHQIITQQPTSPFYDRVDTPEKENLGDLINQSYRKMLSKVAEWKKENRKKKLNWKNYKGTEVRHLLRIPAFGVSQVPIGGDEHIVNAMQKHHGPSFRMVVALGEGEETKMWFIYPGSQTGNPGNVTYAHWINDWASGVYKPLLFTADQKVWKEKAHAIQRITPED